MMAPEYLTPDQIFARSWLSRQKSKPGPRRRRKVARPDPEPVQARPALHGETVSIYSVAIFKLHRESSAHCLCDTCVKVRLRLVEQAIRASE